MKTLTIQHLAPYLPYGVQVKYNDCIYKKTHIATLSGVSNDGIETTYKRRFKGCSGDYISFNGRNNIVVLGVKPILRPLSDLTKEIEHNGEVKPIVIALADVCFDNNFSGELVAKVMIDLKPSTRHEILKTMPYFIIEQLISWHFDVFGLIPDGTAIDINTIQK